MEDLKLEKELRDKIVAFVSKEGEEFPLWAKSEILEKIVEYKNKLLQALVSGSGGKFTRVST